MPDISGIWKNPGTTIAGLIVIIATIGLITKSVTIQDWGVVVGAVAGMRWLLERGKDE